MKKRSRGNAWTYTSRAASQKFWHIDRICFSLSPWITDEESWRIVEQLERLGNSAQEGNFTASESLVWFAEQVGPARYQALCMAWTIENQNAIRRLYAPEQLRDAWVHSITMTEGTPEQLAANPDNYILIQTTRDEFK
jgi:hypothetical protein